MIGAVSIEAGILGLCLTTLPNATRRRLFPVFLSDRIIKDAGEPGRAMGDEAFLMH